MIDKNKIIEILEEHLTNTDLFLVDVKVSGRNKIMVFLDGDKGVPISSCAEVSRHIETILDRDLEDFELEVSSVGLDTPLSSPRQFKKNVGRDIIYLDAEGKKVRAKLLDAGESEIIVEKEVPKKKKKKKEEKDDPVQKLSYKAVREVKVQVSFKKPDK